jgi:hypothetical protein
MRSYQEQISEAILTRIRKMRTSSDAESRGSDCSTVPPAKLREVAISDFDEVSKLKARSGIVVDSLENWNRLWKANPALASGHNRPMGWVLDAEGKIVGYLGNISLQCRYGDKTLTAVATHGFCADPPYRAVALSLASAFYRQKGVDFFVSSSAIEVSGKMALAFKCSRLPQPDYDTVLFWVLRPYSFARLLMKKLGFESVLCSIGGVFVGLSVAIDSFLRRRHPRFAPGALKVTEGSIEEIDGEIGNLFAEKLREGKRFYADRTSEVVRWHFRIPGDRGSVRVFYCYENQKLKGYAVVRREEDPRDGIKRSVIADMIALQDAPAVVKALWVAAYEHAKVAGSDIFEVEGFPSNVREVATNWHPYRRKYPASPYYYRATDPALHNVLNDPAAWYACPFDGDANLIRPSYPSSSVLAATAQVADSDHKRVLDFVPNATKHRTAHI